ncbi:hypothetical protein FHQ28_08770 [Pasteurellaceae bacterium USgator11]|nr:hypothetical protein FHQ20_10210 [Pasteurellaceae bacterium USgator41]TNG98713.1 hypothetical protein FHQ24_07980 [Pasteurellaceae bacterium UScroc31]TNH00080.1 hypothetical protein FHQ28_08770 [Pasteurellaceae bacterium USgator11]
MISQFFGAAITALMLFIAFGLLIAFHNITLPIVFVICLFYFAHYLKNKQQQKNTPNYQNGNILPKGVAEDNESYLSFKPKKS